MLPQSTCSISGCTKPPPFTRGWCMMHYHRWLRHGDPEASRPRTCSIEGCSSPVEARTWCRMHYGRWRCHGDPLFMPAATLLLICSVDSCERVATLRIRGLCSMHNHRLERTGDPLGIRRTQGLLDAPTIARFRRHVPVGLPTDVCWPWIGATQSHGYGAFYYGTNHSVRAHRLSYMVFVGPIPEGMYILHSCDNPPCVNPKHLRPGTHEDNMHDKKERGRSRKRA